MWLFKVKSALGAPCFWKHAGAAQALQASVVREQIQLTFAEANTDPYCSACSCFE